MFSRAVRSLEAPPTEAESFYGQGRREKAMFVVMTPLDPEGPRGTCYYTARLSDDVVGFPLSLIRSRQMKGLRPNRLHSFGFTKFQFTFLWLVEQIKVVY